MPELTPPELQLLRSGPPLIENYVAIAPYGDPAFTARVDDPGGTLDYGSMVIPYDGDVGEANVLPGMTLWVGSSARGNNLGKVRIRSINTVANLITVAENDDIPWADNLHLTCPGNTGFYELWSVYPRMTEAGGIVTFYYDYDVTYTGDHLPPKANAGPPVIVWMENDYVDVEFVGSDSYATEIGQTITAWNWVFPDGTPATSNQEGTRANPITVRWNSPGFRYVRLTVTDSLGTSSTVVIPVWVFQDGVEEPFKLSEILDLRGSTSNGWSCTVRAHRTNSADEEMIYNFPDGALAVVFSRVWYDGIEAEVGKYFTDPADWNQGALTYGALDFTDTGQNFAPWETTTGNAAFLVVVINTDLTSTWAYCGVSEGPGNQRVRIYQDAALTTEGWNGAGIDGKTPASYHIWEANLSHPTIGRGNIRFVGWLDQESLSFNDEDGWVDFTAVSHDGIMRQLPGFAFTLEDETTPTDWYQMKDLCVDRALMHQLHFLSTVNLVCHVEPTGEWNTRTLAIQPFPDASIYSQSQDHLLGDAQYLLLSDHQGIIRCNRDPQIMSTAQRNALTVIASLQTSDWMNDIGETRKHRPEVGSLRLGGFHYETPLLALAPGDAPLQSENEENVDGTILTGQTEANLWAGLLLQKRNNPYPQVPIDLSGYWNVFDPAYREWIRLTAIDPLSRNPFSDIRCIANEVIFSEQGSDFTSLTQLVVEIEVKVESGITQVIPPAPEPADPFPPRPPTIPPEEPPDLVIIHDHYRVYRTVTFQSSFPVWVDITGALDTSPADPYIICCVEFDHYGSGKEAWAVTCQSNLDLNDLSLNLGVWYCADVTAALPIWNMVASQAAFEAVSREGFLCAGGAPINDVWGQIRSLVPTGPAEAYVVEAKPAGLTYNINCVGMNNSSTGYRVNSAGVIDPIYEAFVQNCAECPLGIDCHPGSIVCIDAQHASQSGFRSCHQLCEQPLGDAPAAAAGSFFHVDVAAYCYPTFPCPGSFIFYSPMPMADPSESHPDWTPQDATGWNGSRHVLYYSGSFYATCERPPNFGWLYRAYEGEVLEQGIYGTNGRSFCNLCSGQHLYWVRPHPALPGRVNELIRDGVQTGIESGALFGYDGGVVYDAGVIGHIRCYHDETDGDQIIILRKDEPQAAQPNKQIIYLWNSGTDTLENKTGALAGWRGTDGIMPPASHAQWYGWDNVGVTWYQARQW